MKASLARICCLAMLLPLAAAAPASADAIGDVLFSGFDLLAGGGGKASCDDDCGCCGPTWSVTAGAVILERDRPDSLVLMYDAANPMRNLNADDFDFDFAPGWDFAAVREGACGSIEFRSFAVDGWDGRTRALVGPPTDIIINNAAPFLLPNVTSVDATYDSELFSSEVNLRRPLCDRLDFLAGLRYLELDENFHADADAAMIISTYDTSTANRLYGGQVGVDATLWCCGRLSLNGILKIGGFYNNSWHSTVFDSGMGIFRALDRSDRASFLGEVGFSGTYCLTDRLTLRTGYQVLWLETVTLASDQFPVTNFAAGNGIASDGGAFYHGGFIGCEFRR